MKTRKRYVRAGAACLAALLTVQGMTLPVEADEEVKVRSNSQTQMSSDPEAVYVSNYGKSTDQRTINFDSNWKFNLGDVENAQTANFDDSKWRQVSLPHDYSIEQDYSKSMEAESGYLPGGTGWYRKSFTIDKAAEGKEIRPSGMIGEMKKRFPDLVIHESGEEKCPDVSVTAAKKSVLSWLQEPEKMMDPAQEEPRVLYRFLSSEKETEAEMENLAKAVAYSYKKGEIGRTAARELYGTLLRGSVTRMEGYAACAYSHFLNHGLGLRAGKEYELDLSDMGNLFHQSLDTFFRNIRDHGKDFRTITDAERRTLVRKAVEEVSAKYRNTIMKSSARNAYLEKKVERITDRTVRALIYQIRKGDFEPEEFEVDVSTRIPLKDGEALNLRGRIDRMDVFEDEDKVYVKIMDYKSGSTSFDLELLYHGLQLQLVVYMDAALKMQENRHPGKQAVPAGIFYYHIDDPVIDREDGMTDEEIEAGILRRLRMNGLVNSSLDVIRHMDRDIEKESDVIPVALKDGYVQEVKSSVAGGKRFARLADFVNGQLKTMGGEILDGNVAVNPYKQGNRTACDYCPYHSVCGFDLKTDGYGFRRFRPMKAEEIWKEIDPEESDENETEEQESGNRKPEPGRRKDGEEKM